MILSTCYLDTSNDFSSVLVVTVSVGASFSVTFASSSFPGLTLIRPYVVSVGKVLRVRVRSSMPHGLSPLPLLPARSVLAIVLR
jgi:hypothetical protein